MIARKVVAALAGAVSVLGAAWLTDSVAAMHAENAMAHEVQDTAQLQSLPSVYLGGIPYLGALFTHTIPLIEVNEQDVEVPVLGMVNAATVLRNTTVSNKQVLSGDLEGATVSTLSRSISLDGVALGRLLGMNDLSIANPTDISPSGETSAEAELTGTIPGENKKTTVEVDLRLVGPMFHMTPQDSDDLSDRARTAFSLQLDTRQLPLPAQATKVSLRGGQITFEMQRRNVTLTNGQLSPFEIAGEFSQNADG